MEPQVIFGYEISKENWVLIQIPLSLVITLIISLVFHFIFSRLEKAISKIKNLWTRSTIQSIKWPTTFLICFSGLFYALNIVRKEYDLALFDAVPSIANLVQITIIAWFALRFIHNFSRNYVAKQKELDSKYDVTTSDTVVKILMIATIVLAGLIGMETLGLSIAGILAFGGVGGIAIGFAAQELIANYFGGLMIYMDRPFKVGDRVRSTEMDIWGTIEEIGWRQTKIRRIDMRLLYVPNSSFAKISVINVTQQANRYISEYVGIRYDDAHLLKDIVHDIDVMVRNHPGIDPTTSRLAVNFVQFAASSLDILINCYTRTKDWVEYQAVKQDVLIKAMEIITEHGAEIAFPTSTIHIASVEQEQVQNQEIVLSQLDKETLRE